MSIFIEEIDKLKVMQQALQNKYNTISTLRIVIALGGIAFAVLGIMKANTNYIYPVLICLVLFVGLILQHMGIREQLNRTKCLMRINQDYIDRKNGEWISFQDCGNEFEDANHAYVSDLDIFGSHSLFQFLNCTSTFLGRNYLAELLKNPNKNLSAIKERQGAVRELAGKIDFCRNFQCEGKLREDSGCSPEKLIIYAKGTDKLFKYKWQEWVIILLTMSSILTIALLIMKISMPIYVPAALFLIQGIITLFGFKCRRILDEVNGIKRSLETYRGLLVLIEREDFEDNHLSQMKSELFDSGAEVLKGLKKLDIIIGAADIKFSPVIHFILNTALLWDYHCVFELEAWKAQYGKHIAKWLKNIGKFEAYVSLAVVSQVNEACTFPEFGKEDMAFIAKNLGHPLINSKKRVTNSLHMRDNICIITGSNMSGKTTMLRTIGINLVLAYAGAPAIAKSMTCSIMNVFTSMRIKDDLNSGISTFYAELLRIKTIIEFAASKQPMIFLLDEIFRGTNSKDRMIGAKSVIDSLNKKWIIGLVSTHDFELCDLEEDGRGRIRNFHFTEHYVEDKIEFDYKLKEGRCHSTNAKYLMKLVGIELME